MNKTLNVIVTDCEHLLFIRTVDSEGKILAQMLIDKKVEDAENHTEYIDTLNDALEKYFKAYPDFIEHNFTFGEKDTSEFVEHVRNDFQYLQKWDKAFMCFKAKLAGELTRWHFDDMLAVI